MHSITDFIEMDGIRMDPQEINTKIILGDNFYTVVNAVT